MDTSGNGRQRCQKPFSVDCSLPTWRNGRYFEEVDKWRWGNHHWIFCSYCLVLWFVLPQTINQSISQSVNQSVNQLISQSVNQSISQSINQSISQSISQSINQSINHSVNQSINKSINQSINLFISQSSNHSLSSLIEGILLECLS